jgi:hypothetical protein
MVRGSVQAAGKDRKTPEKTALGGRAFDRRSARPAIRRVPVQPGLAAGEPR